MSDQKPPSRKPAALLRVVAIVLAVPIIPAVVLGDSVSDWALQWRGNPASDHALAVGIAGLLALDTVLPVPSGPLITFAGARLGATTGAAVAWSGMTAGACAAFALAKYFGPQATAKIVSRSDLAGFRRASGDARWLLLATRPVPVLAEAAVVFYGLAGLRWRDFLPPVLAGNLILAVAFSALGQSAAVGAWLEAALILAIALPTACALAARRMLRARSSAVGSDTPWSVQDQ